MSDPSASLIVRLRRQTLERDPRGYHVWRVHEEPVTLPAAETALLLCDVWDTHTCRGAVERLEAMLPRMVEVVDAARRRGVQIVHAPSDTMAFYADHPARQRVRAAPAVEPPADRPYDDPPLPVAADDPCDTDDNPGMAPDGKHPWTRQNAAIAIDPDRDAISDSGRELYSFYGQRGIRHVLIMGVHTNMCVLHRTFAIKQLVRWGLAPALVRDLTDTMYNPAVPPYVDHDEGTRLVVGYIEKFWCPTLDSGALLSG